MTFKETGFRPFYHNYCAVTLNRALSEQISGIEGHESAEYALTYGYMDPENGLRLLVLAAAIKDENNFGFADDTTNKLRFVGIEEVADQEFFYFHNENGGLDDRYINKIKLLEPFEVDEDLEKSREMDFLDDSRDSVFIDNVTVYLRKYKLIEEPCMAQIVGLGSKYFIAKLIDEPKQDFGHHAGDTFTFTLNEVGEGKVRCVANLDTPQEFTAEDLADGEMLKEAVSLFNKNRTEQGLFSIMNILRDSNVWVPCRAMAVEGQPDQMAYFPDILVHDNENFLPIFTSPKELEQYGGSVEPIQKSVVETIQVARLCDKKLAGIVLNPFTEPFIINAEFWEILENMKSNLK